MSPVVRGISLHADQLPVSLSGAPDAFVYQDGGASYCGAFADATSRQLDPSDSILEAETSASDQFDVPRWVGMLPYDAFRSMERKQRFERDTRPTTVWSSPVWKRYPAVAKIGKDSAMIVAEDELSADRLHRLLMRSVSAKATAPSLTWARSPEPSDVHRRRIMIALEAIARGDLYQVNLARRFEFETQGGVFSLLSALQRSGAAPFGAAFDWAEHSAISLSPELFLDVSPDGRVITRPIKGTRPRTGEAAADEQAARELDSSEKERAELTMVVDLERNDLSRLAKVGSVKLSQAPSVVVYPTVLHRQAEVTASVVLGTSLKSLLLAMCPSGSVTGAPKVSAMDMIASLEAHRRGLYTGALGYITRCGRMRLSMAIRTLAFAEGQAHYYSGGGIVADSDPQQEVEETLWKAEQLSSLVHLGSALD